MPRTMSRRRREESPQLLLFGLEDVDLPAPEPPPELVIPAELVMSVEGWRLPHGWRLLPGESVEGAIAAFLAMERMRSKTK